MSDRTALRRFQVQRALDAGLVPPPDRARGWSAAVVNDIAARVEQIREQVGRFPDVGAERAAGVLTEWLCVDVPPTTIPELARRGALPIVGEFKGHPVYCGRALEAFIAARDMRLLDEAIRAGELFTADGAAAVLNVRRTDFDHLVRAGLVEPTEWMHSAWQSRRSAPTVPLYREGDLWELRDRTDIAWAAVRSTPKGGRSPLADLPAKGTR